MKKVSTIQITDFNKLWKKGDLERTFGQIAAQIRVPSACATINHKISSPMATFDSLISSFSAPQIFIHPHIAGVMNERRTLIEYKCLCQIYNQENIKSANQVYGPTFIGLRLNFHIKLNPTCDQNKEP